MELSWPASLARRLTRHGLAEPVPAEQLAQQVGVICGAHAQVITAAELSIGLRVAGITRANVQQALWTDHRLIKTFGPRGTVHLLPADELALWTAAFSALPPVRPPTSKDNFLTPEQTDAVVEGIRVVLADAEMTVDELNAALIDTVGAWAGELVMPAFQTMWPRWRQAVDAAANRGALCFGPIRGRHVTYTNPGRWIPKFKPASARRGVAFLIKRYLHAYGPATPQQVAKWLNIPVRWATEQFASLRDELEQVMLDGAPAWVAAGDTAAPNEPPGGVRLLPYFDAYAVGSHPRERIFPGRAFERALNRGQAGNFPVVLVDGVVAGVWHQKRTGQKLALTVELFGKLTDRQRRELDAQVARVGEVMEGQATLTLDAVTVGAHA